LHAKQYRTAWPQDFHGWKDSSRPK
jgi:hypothetical protein